MFFKWLCQRTNLRRSARWFSPGERLGVHWRQPARGHHGERITCMEPPEQFLFLTREGHALVAGEEAIELKCG